MANTNKPFKILIIDDDEMHRKLEKAILSGPEYEVTEAVNGKDGLSLIRKQDFDVLLLDKCMPAMNGDDISRYIRQDLKLALLPIIMVTGTTGQGELEKSLLAGANDFIQKPYIPAELIARVRAAATKKRITDQMDNMESILFALARMVEAKDSTTGDHCSRLEYMGEVFGHKLSLSDDEILALRRGGILHDIGKLGIPDNILLKSGQLTDDEWNIMRQHTIIGSRLCSGLNSMKLTIPIIRHHHERWDGSGYPDGLKATEIPYLARVFQILDIYDALSSERPYKKAFTNETIIQIFEEETAKGWRDPELINIFLTLLKNHPQALITPEGTREDLGSQIFNDIRATGSLDWGRELNAKNG